MPSPLRAKLEESADRFIMTYDGYLDDVEIPQLFDLEKRVQASPRRAGLIFVQGTEFEGFHRSQVSRHATVFNRIRPKLYGIGVANARGTVRFAIASVAMLTRLHIKGFETLVDAHKWLDTMRDSA